MPRRKPAYRRVTPLASRRETQRRAALAVLALVVVVGGLGLGVYAFGGSPTAGGDHARSTPARRRSTRHGPTWPRSAGPGSTSSTDDPDQALELLTDAYEQLDIADAANVSATVLAPLRQQVDAGLDRLYGVVPVALEPICSRSSRPRAPTRSTSSQMVRGPDGNPYVIDRTTKAVYRIDLKTKEATLVVTQGTKNKSGHRRARRASSASAARTC